MTDIEKQLQAARQNLLDLTMRNRLLNFRPTKARTVRVVDEIPREVYDILVLKEKGMEFHPKPGASERGYALDDEEQGRLVGLEEKVSGLTQEEASVLWRLPPSDAKVATRHVDRFLQTSLESEALQKRLFYIHHESASILEELGYSSLYLGVAFLEWTESPDSVDTRQAPLILVPVELERSRVGSSFKLRWNGEDIATNISLQAMLSDQGISLPDFEMPDDKAGIDQYLQCVVRAISRKPKWQVVMDIYLGFFSFTKFIMYKDLDPHAWPKGMSPLDHPLLRTILDPCSDRTVSEQGFMEDEVDQKLIFSDLYHVRDADPSQIAVIEDVKAGRNLVTEGPPGTGKSQTITNIIAELLASGKRVLFVSEKMAALEVVKSHLDGAGLGDFCLELHSRKSNKREVLKELERTISRRAPQSMSLQEEFDQLETLKSDLNGYAKALNQPFGKLARSPFALFCMKETARRHFAEVGRDMVRVQFSNLKRCTQKEHAEARSKLENLADVVPLVRPLAGHPWQGCRPGTLLPSDEDEVGTIIDECRKHLRELEATIDHLIDACGIQQPIALDDLSMLAEYQALARRLFKLFNNRYRHLKRKICVRSKISRKRVRQAIVDVLEAERCLVAELELLAKRIGADYGAIFGTKIGNVSFTDIGSRLDSWRTELPRLQRWAQFVALRDDCLNTVAEPIIEILDSSALEPEDIIPCFEGNFADALLRHVFAERPALASFIGNLHENRIRRFADLDRNLIIRNRQRLVDKLYHHQPHISGDASPGSELGILQGEFGRRRGHMPIRKLMSLAGGLIQRIKPCFMMSPLSIAQFLGPRNACFDVIVFDEASQVRPEDALGALLRGNQVVVMGDTRQLPPTSFFDHIVESADDEEQDLPAPVAEIESILHQCKRCFPMLSISEMGHFLNRTLWL